MTTVHPSLPVSLEELRPFCEKWKVKELALFGSAARGEMRPDSDYDIMVEFEPDARWSLWDLVPMHEEIQALLGRKVDLLEKAPIRNPYRRASIERDLIVIYAAAGS
jgi:predicted nucleotidyltransferase